MASSFIGLPVAIAMRSGLSITGTVQSVNAVQGTIVLSSAHLHQPGQEGGEGEYLGTRALSRTEVVGLEVISVRKEGEHQQHQHQRGGERRQQRTASSGQSQDRQQQPHPQQHYQPQSSHYTPQLSDSDPASYSDVSRSHSQSESPAPGSARKPKANKRSGRQTSRQAMSGGWETGNEADGDWSAVEGERGDSRGSARHRQPPHGAPSFPPAQHPSTQAQYAHSTSHQLSQEQQSGHGGSTSRSFDLNEEFDFGAGLRSFDKKKVFEQIRSQDATDPSQLLVSHNRLSSSGRPHDARMVKLLPNESVLSAHELEEQKDDGAAALEGLSLGGAPGGREESTGEESQDYSTAESETSAGRHGLGERRGTLRPNQEGNLLQQREPGWYTTDGVKVAPVKHREWREVLSVADIESSPSPLHRQSTTAHSLASYLLSLRLPAQSTICLLAPGCSEKGTLALRAATHLCNRGWRMVVWTGRTPVSPEAEGAEERKEALRVFSTSSGRVLRDLADLQPETYALVVDAIADSAASSSGAGGSATTPSVEEMAAARWVAESGLKALSVDSAWGRDVDTGATLHPSPITPTYLCSLGALRHGATLLATTATELSILDVGLSPALWSRCGVDGVHRETFGNGWWVGVERT